ncbi:histidine--tRNA ligase [Psittacicella gerlachiana]|uniref:Histidine--tRNA ligase n=1 Tax=Psittacicella gerlachiana TaxID=2028574 RepID=A0A3A1YN79_9GAMM|nr:histidine--tRNA ligase [Psittacicella gerlachiana]RIY38689.1 histidine--tRNA ligase [Psittacicella gerlachiana]
MNKAIKSLRGFNDVLPQDSHLFNKTLRTLEDILEKYCINEIRTPYLESTALFARGVGEATDIVEKEMFSFTTNDQESVSLRPEGTAGAMRACIEHGLSYNQEQRLYYFGPMFRYERPQKGRYRQFHQLGVEILGIRDPGLEAEVLLMNAEFWKALGISEYITLEINTIGTSEARANYGKALVSYLETYKEQLDADSQRRLTSNPLRILDSKDEKTQAVLANAPVLEDFLDQESKDYFETLKEILTANGLDFVVNPKLVRGLDYYNDTVFEWTTTKLGAQATVCAGGRYDRLVEILGGHATPGFGFGLGYERLLLLLEEVHGKQEAPHAQVFIINDGKVQAQSLKIALELRAAGIKVLNNLAGGKLKKQFAKADKSGAPQVIIVNEELVAQGQVNVKHLATGEQETVSLDTLVSKLKA